MKRMTYFYATTLIFLCSFGVKVFAADYTFSSDAEITAFINAQGTTKIAVDNLTITGTVTQIGFAPLIDIISAVNGDLTFKDLTVTTWSTSGSDQTNNGGIDNISEFIATVPLNKGLIVKNTQIGNVGRADGFLMPEVINGDLILDNNPIPFPDVDGWSPLTSFGNVKDVKGSYIIRLVNSLQKLDRKSFTKLESVGGDFQLLFTNKAVSSWDVSAPNFTYIGGNLVIRGDSIDPTMQLQFWSLEILQNIEYIGGNVTIVNLPRMQLGGSGDCGCSPGFCFIRYLIDQGIINYACHNVVLGNEGDPIDLATLGGCYNGVDMDVPPEPLPEKDPNCSTTVSIPVVKAMEPFATAFAVNGELNIDSRVALNQLTIFGLDGKSVAKYSDIAVGKTTFSIKNLTSGVYIIKMLSVDNQFKAVKIIK
jgi:hypothetical protein